MSARLLRVLGSLFLLSLWGFVNVLPDDVRALELGKVAALQFQTSDVAYYANIAQTAFWSRFGMSTGLLVVLLILSGGCRCGASSPSSRRSPP